MAGQKFNNNKQHLKWNTTHPSTKRSFQSRPFEINPCHSYATQRTQELQKKSLSLKSHWAKKAEATQRAKITLKEPKKSWIAENRWRCTSQPYRDFCTLRLYMRNNTKEAITHRDLCESTSGVRSKAWPGHNVGRGFEVRWDQEPEFKAICVANPTESTLQKNSR